jgi:hypothetical protein
MTAAGAQGLEEAGVGSPAEADPTGLAGEDLARVDPIPGHRARGRPVPVHTSSVRNRLDRDQRAPDQPGRGLVSQQLALGPRGLARLVLRRIAAVTTFPMAPVSPATPIAWRQTVDRGARPAAGRSSAVVEAAVQASNARVRRDPAPAPLDRVAINPAATNPVATGSADDRSACATSMPGAPQCPRATTFGEDRIAEARGQASAHGLARDRSAIGPGLLPPCRRRTCSVPLRNSSQVGDRSRKRSLRDGLRFGCSLSPSAANRSNNWCSTPRACGSRSSSSKVVR